VSCADVPADARPIDDTLRARVLEPFIAGALVALREVALTDAAESNAYQCQTRRVRGDWGVTIELTSSTEGILALGFDHATAVALAKRMLAETPVAPDEALVQDCAGELANVVAGQAKACLAATPDRFTFTPPRFAPANADFARPPMQTCLVVVFNSGVGNLALQLFLR